MTLATNVRKTLYEDVKRRFVDNERDGHLEDLLVSTILDPRFKLMNFEGECYRLVLLQGSTYNCLIDCKYIGFRLYTRHEDECRAMVEGQLQCGLGSQISTEW